jgi:hypothetical protein
MSDGSQHHSAREQIEEPGKKSSVPEERVNHDTPFRQVKPSVYIAPSPLSRLSLRRARASDSLSDLLRNYAAVLERSQRRGVVNSFMKQAARDVGLDDNRATQVAAPFGPGSAAPGNQSTDAAAVSLPIVVRDTPKVGAMSVSASPASRRAIALRSWCGISLLGLPI